MAFIQEIDVSLAAVPQDDNFAIVELSQNENGRKLYFHILGVTIPEGSSATISGTKPDNVVYSKSGTVSGDYVIIEEDTQMTAVAGEWDAKIHIVNGGNQIGSARVRFAVDKDPVAAGAIPSDSQLDGIVAQAQAYAEEARSAAYGSPLTASTASAMTDKTKVYVYTGSESGYTAGHWYYWNGSAWTDGGVYNAVAVQTDKTLAVEDKAADAKATGDQIAALKDELSQVICPNLMGMKNWAQYPVDFSHNKYLTISTSDGSVFKSDSNLKVIFLNENGNVLDSGWRLNNEQPYRTITMPDSYLNVVKYLQWNGYAESSVPLMVNYGTVALDYVEYEEPIRDVLKTKVDKTAIEKLIYDANHTVITSLDGWEIGTFRSHEPVASSVRIRNMNIYLVEPGSTIESNGNIQFKVIFYDALGRYQTETGWKSGVYTITGSPTPYVRFFLRHDDESATSLADLEKIYLNLITPSTPSMKIHVVSQYSIGDCMILKTSEEKCILIDLGREQDYARLKNALICENVTKIDYVIISHYHSDHVNTPSLTNLISDFDLSGCNFILPPEIPSTYIDPDGYGDALRTRQSEVISLLSTNNISYINEYNCDMWHMWLCGIEFDFYNMDHSSWYSQNTDYNQMSIVCVANVGNNTVFFTGDMGNLLETKLLPIFNRTVTIAKFGHHGLNTYPNLDFWHKIKPELLFATTPEVWHDELIAASHQIRFANYNDIKYISAHVSGGQIIINVDPNGYSTDGYNYMLDNLSSEEFFDYVL